MWVIRRFARQVADRFHPYKIVLFGSHAYGLPHEDSDVDLLVIMKARNEIDAAIRIQTALLPPFPLDLIVRKPKEVRWRLAEGESFLSEIMARGKVLHEKSDTRMAQKSRSRLENGANPCSRAGKAI
jgi:predicted nucleotidyltransferase